MRIKLILALVFSVVFLPAAFCWEYTFDTDQGWSYFDNDTGGRVAVSPSDGVLSVDYPDYGFFSVRYIFADKDTNSPWFGSNKDLTGGYVSATLSYSGSQAPTFAYFFFAGAGDPGDDQVYVTEEASWVGGTQTFWASSVALELGGEMTEATLSFSPSEWSMLSVGSVHDDQRGTAASWDDSLASVDAVGIMLGYVGTPPEGAKLNIDEFTVTPEPSILLLSGPLAGFLGWAIRRKARRSPRKA